MVQKEKREQRIESLLPILNSGGMSIYVLVYAIAPHRDPPDDGLPTEDSGLRAVVIFYGVYRLPELMGNLRVPVLAFQGDADSYREFIDNAFAMQRIAQENHRQFELVIYKNAKHGFDYGSSPVFSPSAAHDSWNKTVAFLDRYLKP